MSYYIQINGGPKIGWPATFATRTEAEAKARVINARDGLTASVAEVDENWTISPDGDVAWLIGGPTGLRFQRNPSAPW